VASAEGRSEAELHVFAVLALVQVLFGVHYAVAKELLRWMEPAAWATLRIVVAALVLQAFVFRRGGGLPRSFREWIRVAGLALCGVVVNQVCFVEGLSRTIPAHSALIMTTIPLWTVAFATALRKERPTLRRAAAIVCGLLGVWTLLRADRFHLDLDLLPGDLLTLVNTAAYGLFLVLGKRYVEGLDASVATARIFAVGAVGIAAYGLDDLVAADLRSLPGSFWVLAAYAILGATVIAHGLNLWALRRTVSSLVALFVYLQPIVATAVDGILLGRWPSWRFGVAAVLVFIGVGLGLPRRAVRPPRAPKSYI
jgi:drug/metabolite transporter (DMT)-like permease